MSYCPPPERLQRVGGILPYQKTEVPLDQDTWLGDGHDVRDPPTARARRQAGHSAAAVYYVLCRPHESVRLRWRCSGPFCTALVFCPARRCSSFSSITDCKCVFIFTTASAQGGFASKTVLGKNSCLRPCGSTYFERWCSMWHWPAYAFMPTSWRTRSRANVERWLEPKIVLEACGGG